MATALSSVRSSRSRSTDSSSSVGEASQLRSLRTLDALDDLCSGHRLSLSRSSTAVTSSGRLQVDAQRAVLSNTPLKLYVLAEEHGMDGCFPGMLASNLLALALQAGCNAKTLAALLECGCDANGHVLLKTDRGEPARAVLPLLYAAERQDVGAVRCLLAAGADPLSNSDASGMTPLEEAATSSDETMLRIMLEYAVKLHGSDRLRTIAARRPSVATALLMPVAGTTSRKRVC